MLNVIYKKCGIRIGSIWFAQGRDIFTEKNCDIAFYHQSVKPIEGGHKSTVFYTLVTDVKYSDEDIISKFQHRTNYKIRRAEKAGVSVRYYSPKELSEDNSIIMELSEAYRKHAESKNLTDKFNLNLVNAYIKANSFFVTCALYNNRNLVYHTYIGDGNIARGIHSVSLFRQSDANSERNLIGEANRMLHRDDILLFKRMGYSIYDWGGAAMHEEVKGVAEFKSTFGGDLLETYNCLIPCSILGCIVLKVRDVAEGLIAFFKDRGAENGRA